MPAITPERATAIRAEVLAKANGEMTEIAAELIGTRVMLETFQNAKSAAEMDAEVIARMEARYKNFKHVTVPDTQDVSATQTRVDSAAISATIMAEADKIAKGIVDQGTAMVTVAEVAAVAYLTGGLAAAPAIAQGATGIAAILMGTA